MSLNEIIEGTKIAFMGNRVTEAGALLATTTTYHAFSQLDSDSWQSAVSWTVCWVGFGLMAITKLGQGTKRYYLRTLKEVEEKGEASVDFFKERIIRTDIGRFIGYCQLQGMYLGAKKTGQLDNFYQAKEEVSNCVIPNF